MNRSSSTKKMVLAGLFLALGLVLPSLTGHIPALGSKLLPMHLPVLLAGYVCGWPYGLIVGFIVPLFHSMLFGMPPIFPTAVSMALELAAYGFLSGILYKALPKKNIYIVLSLILSMIGGRIVWGIVTFFLYGLSGTEFTLQLFMAGAFINALPGILLQLIVIPVIVIALKRGSIVANE